jgi:chemotaxis methyl-accepting protein methylase
MVVPIDDHMNGQVLRFVAQLDADLAIERMGRTSSPSSTAIAKILQEKGPDETGCIWVPACSTGEEVYSVTILVKEEMERQGRTSRIQVFGTDLDETAIGFARATRYRKTTGLSSGRRRA